jgi:endonuclease/exonuclease/phosphatase family metal-dependent hydrolase
LLSLRIAFLKTILLAIGGFALVGGLLLTGAFQYALASTLHSWSKPYFNVAEYSAFPNCDGHIPCSSGLMRVMTFNVLCRLCSEHDFDSSDVRWPHVFDVVRKNAPDLLGLQELTGKRDIDEFLAAFPNYAAVAYQFGDWTDADSTILYRKDEYNALDSGQMWLTPQPSIPFAAAWNPLSIPRYVNWVYLSKKGNGFRFLLVNTHFDNHRRNKETSARLFATTLHPVAIQIPIIATGDFNIDTISNQFTSLTSAEAGSGMFTDSADLAAEKSVIGNTPGSPVPHGKEFYLSSERAIDHIMLAGPVRKEVYQWAENVSVYGHDNHHISDHPSVYADVSLETLPKL